MKKIKQLLQFVFLLLFLASCGASKEKTRPSVEDISESVYASGIVKSYNQYQVFSPVNGIIKKIWVNEGDTIKKNGPVMQIESETAKLNTQNAELAAAYAAVSANAEKLNDAKTAIDLAGAKMQNDSLLLIRQKNLWSAEIGTRNELEQRELAFKNSRSAYQSAIFRYKDLQKQLVFSEKQSKNNVRINRELQSNYIIRSETEGRVYELQKEEGEIVNIQNPVAIIGSTAFLLELQVDEYDISKIQRGQKVFFTMDSYKAQVFEARVTKIAPIMNDRTRSFVIEAAFIAQPAVLYPNLTVEANILIRSKQNALTIPRDYLIGDSMVLLDNEEKRKVETGLKDYLKAEILRGVTADDVIVKPAL